MAAELTVDEIEAELTELSHVYHGAYMDAAVGSNDESFSLGQCEAVERFLAWIATRRAAGKAGTDG